MSKTRNKKYSKELKTAAVQGYLSGKGSMNRIGKKHKILSDRQLRNWIKVYGIDNGPMKEFMEMLKSEMYYLRPLTSAAELTTAIK